MREKEKGVVSRKGQQFLDDLIHYQRELKRERGGGGKKGGKRKGEKEKVKPYRKIKPSFAEKGIPRYHNLRKSGKKDGY